MLLAHLTRRALLRVTGKDAEKILQTLVTQDLRDLRSGRTALPALFLDKHGKAELEVMISKPSQLPYTPPIQPHTVHGSSPTLETFFIEHSGSCTPLLLNKLKKYRWGCHLHFDHLTTHTNVLQLFPPASHVDSLTYNTNMLHSPQTLMFPDPRSPEVLGIRLYTALSPDAVMQHNRSMISRFVTQDTADAHRLAHGIIENDDLTPHREGLPCYFNTFPSLFNFDWLGYLHFNKGCYIGQESVARIRSTFIQRKRVVIFKISIPLTTDIPYKISLSYMNRELSIPVVASRGAYVAVIINTRQLNKTFPVLQEQYALDDITAPQAYEDYLKRVSHLQCHVVDRTCSHRVPAHLVVKAMGSAVV